ncbi:MAG: hypothetical protein ACXWT0_15175, partial [Methylobacter sp.]
SWFFFVLTGGVATLNPRLIAGNPPGCKKGILTLVYNDERRSVGTIANETASTSFKTHHHEDTKSTKFCCVDFFLRELRAFVVTHQ